jgi:uncharacterized membrane protein
LNLIPAPALALTASVLIGVTTILLQDCVRRTNPILTMPVVTLAGTGIFMTAAWFCIFKALSTGDAVVVTPLASLHPLVVVGLSRFVMQDKNEVGAKTALGVVFVVTGVLLITIGQAR